MLVFPLIGESAELELSGVVAAEARTFFQDPADERQFSSDDFSGYVQPKLYAGWEGGRQQLVFVPFYRVDKEDEERTHGDIRELNWTLSKDAWSLRAGIGKVFWGVTEFAHVVDVINQTDLVENIDMEDKLGQPMINLSLFQGWGTLDLFVLPFFRERTFPGTAGRLRPVLPVETSLTGYEASDEERHVDLSALWFHFFGDLEVGVYHFYGNSREPRFVPTVYQAQPVLAPYYDLMQQTGVNLLLLQDQWLWKFEGIRRQTNGRTFFAGTGGFEYTFTGIAGTEADLGVIGEYVSDGRGDEAPPLAFDNDAMLGLRVAFNDAESSELLLSYARGLAEPRHFISLKGSRRLGESIRLSMEARSFKIDEVSNPLYGMRDDDYLQLELGWYF